MSADRPTKTQHGIEFREAFWVWVKVAIYSFGGPAGQIAVMHKFLVEEKNWISEDRFLHALNYCMLLPGPEAQQLATYLGWLLHGYRGGLVAGVLFIVPGFVSILILSVLYAGFQQVTFVEALFFGLKAAVLAIVIEAVITIGKRALKNRFMIGLSAAAFVAIFAFDVAFPIIILLAGLVGFLGSYVMPETFAVIEEKSTPAGTEADEVAAVDAMFDDQSPEHTRPSKARALGVFFVFMTLWWVPVLVVGLVVGFSDTFSSIGIFFSKTAVVTFGGAYAVLAYIAQRAVETYGWLLPGEMLDGLGMAETTPGPLIQVVQFVGFMAAYRHPGTLDPMVAGTLGAILTTWVTFVPCFLWIFLGAPYIEYLRGNERLSAALSTITAAVVGVILNLAVWFALHVLFAETYAFDGPLGIYLDVPVWNSFVPGAGVISVYAFVALLYFDLGMLWTLGTSTAAGMLWFYLLS